MKNQLFGTIAIFSLFFVLVSKITFGQTDSTFIFSKLNRTEVKMIVVEFYYVDTEDFDHCGGWQMDNQFVHLTGSSYLMATGVGEPGEDAKTSINISKDGEFYVWVRARNWEKEYVPGRIKVLVEALKKLNVSPVVKIPEGSIELACIQRKTKEADICLISNQSGHRVNTVAGFRTVRKKP